MRRHIGQHKWHYLALFDDKLALCPHVLAANGNWSPDHQHAGARGSRDRRLVLAGYPRDGDPIVKTDYQIRVHSDGALKAHYKAHNSRMLFLNGHEVDDRSLAAFCGENRLEHKRSRPVAALNRCLALRRDPPTPVFRRAE